MFFDFDHLDEIYPNLVGSFAPRTKFNVCGHRYEIATGFPFVRLAMLDSYPETLLGNIERRETFRYDDQTLFLHRHSKCFAYILFYYIQGFVQRPMDIPLDVFVEECRYFIVPYQSDENENFILHYQEISKTSTKNFVSSIIDIILTLVSLLILFIEDSAKVDLIFQEFLSDGQSTIRLKYPYSIASTLELICTSWFIMNFFLNSSVHQQRWNLFIDLISISPVLFSLLFYTISYWFADLSLIHPLLICLKSFRILRLVRSIQHFELIRRTLFLSLNNLSIAFILTSLFLIPCAMLIFLLERSQSKSDIFTFHDGLGWAIETLTTIGFGQDIPKTYQGRIFSILLCLFGLILLALPIPIIFRKYQFIYQNALKEKLWRIYR